MTRRAFQWKTAASLDVDAQRTFSPLCPDELPVPDALAIVPELNRQANDARLRLASKDAHSPHALWVAQEHTPPAFSPLEGAEGMDRYWPSHAVPGTEGFELLPGLPAIESYDYVVWKGVEPHLHPYGACYHDLRERLSTGLIEFLRHEGIEHVLVGGLATDYCVKATALQLLRAGFSVILNRAACRGVAPQTTAEAWDIMIQAGALWVSDAEELSALCIRS